MRVSRMALTAVVAAAVLASPHHAAADGGWIDAPRTQWNGVGMPVPAAVPDAGAPFDPACARFERPAELPEDAMLQAAGWKVFGTYEGGWGVRVIKGLSGYDGMCRPMGFNEFVFVDGTFAGTISPEPMNSRMDGVVQGVYLYSATDLEAEYARYAPNDPLCCPSSKARVGFTVNRTPTGPVLAAK